MYLVLIGVIWNCDVSKHQQIGWIHSLQKACDSAWLVPNLVCIFLVWRSWFYLVLKFWLFLCRPRGSSYRRWILWFHGIYVLSVCRCCRFVLDPIAVEISLTFVWYTSYLHGVWRWFFMVCGNGFLHGVWRWLHLKDL